MLKHLKYFFTVLLALILLLLTVHLCIRFIGYFMLLIVAICLGVLTYLAGWLIFNHKELG